MADRIGKDVHGRFVVTTSVLSELMGLHSRNFLNYHRDYGMPEPISRGLYDLGAVMKWEEKCRKEKPVVVDADMRLKEIKAKRQELAYQKELGEVVEREGVVRVVSRAIIGARNVLTLLVRKILARLPQDVHADVEPLLEEAVGDALEELSHGVREVKDGA